MLDMIFKGIEIIGILFLLGIGLELLTLFIQIMIIVGKSLWLLIKGIIKSRTLPLAFTLTYWCYHVNFTFSMINKSLLFDATFRCAVIIGIITVGVAWIAPVFLLKIPAISRWNYQRKMHHIADLGVAIPESWRQADIQKRIFY